MKRPLAAAALAVLVPLGALAQTDYLAQSDSLSHAEQNTQSFALLSGVLPTVASDQDRAEIYWRLSRDTLHEADYRQAMGASKAELLARYKKGEGFADQCIAADPSNPHGYFWKASNLGRWGQTRGVLASLNLVDPIRKLAEKAVSLDPTYGDPWFLLGQLYEQVPQFLSYGNVQWAVSLGRKAVDARTDEVERGVEKDVPLDYYVQLARHLAKRNWSESKRAQEQPIEAQKFASIQDVAEKNDYYEGSVQIPDLSDRDEAKQIDRFVISQVQAISNPTPAQTQDLDHARSDLASLGG